MQKLPFRTLNLYVPVQYVCIYSCMEIEKNTDAEYNRLVNAQEIEIFK